MAKDINLGVFADENIQRASLSLLADLGIEMNVHSEQQIHIPDIMDGVLGKTPKAVLDICDKIKESYLVGVISDETFLGHDKEQTFVEARDNKYDQMLVFSVDFKRDAKLTRSEMATLTRALNRASKDAPVMLVCRYADDEEVRFAMSLCERTAYKQSGHTGEKVGKVNILRGINPEMPHTGHVRIIEDMRLERGEDTFEAVYKKWFGVFNNDVLTEQFYKELQNWFFWAIKHVQFPNDIDDNTDDMKYNPQNVIRLITRLIFVWFLRQKGLVPKALFNREDLDRLVKDFEPDNFESSTYYRVILQNLFFATLNKNIEERAFVSEDFVLNRNKGIHNIKTFMRHASDLKVPKEEFINLLHPVPFMNNSLFECLDNKVQNGKTYNWDGFSDSNKPQRQAFVPNYLFFAKEEYVDLSEEYDSPSASSTKVFGLLTILKRYNFTVEENTPLDQDVALDPELLGKVFENLLAAYNPETEKTVRKSTGSYYTPRSIVQYMVDESLVAYLTKTVPSVDETTIRSLISYSDDNQVTSLTEEQTNEIVEAVFNCKVLDPACGSGAFPMGMLQQMSHLLSRVDADNKRWEKVVIDRALHDFSFVEKVNDEEKAAHMNEIDEVFRLSVEYPDYARKLYLIENCIYGVDIQTIAVQISRLRFFISLLCEQQPSKDASKNYNIKPLPNLEMKFVSANTLIRLEHIEETRQLFSNKEILDLIEQLKGVRHELFIVTDNHVKRSLKNRDLTLRDRIMLSTGECYVKDTEEKVKQYELTLIQLENALEKAQKEPDELVRETVQYDLFGDEQKTVIVSSKERKIKDITSKIRYYKSEVKRLKDTLISGKDKAMRLAKQLTAWDPYDQNVSSPFFDPEWMFGINDGFDIVIGNPPYIQLQNNGGELAAMYENCGFSTFARTGDIYCLFYERGWQLLKDGGHLCYITSNKWMRAGYGEKTREFFATKTNPKLLIDFAGVKIFESATVDTNILLLARSENEKQTICAVTSKNSSDCIKELGDFVKQQYSICEFTSSDSWVILSPIEQSIKRKIESIGTPLKDWDIQIYRGVLTGYNEAFIISTEKRNEILNNCFSADERKRTEELIRPILRGRDIKRYGYDWADLWLINTHNGIRGVKERIHIEDYPSVRAHLDQYWNKISKRADKGDTAYNLRNCAYLDDFNKPKVMWKIIGCNINFCFDEKQMICNNAVDIMVGEPSNLIQFVGLMNSKLFDWYLKLTTEAEVQGGGIQLYVTTLEKTLLKLDFDSSLTDIIYKRMQHELTDEIVDEAVFKAYKLTKEEQLFITNDRRVNRI